MTTSADELSKPIRIGPSDSLPRLGLGVFRSGSGDGTRNAIRWALEAGYRHFDTASVYGNEIEVGEALRGSDIARDELFITTKLWRDDFGYDEALRGFDGSLQRLGVEAIDLYLLHWPVPETRVDSWRALEEIRRSGRCRAIGVSNFTVGHLEQLIEETGIVPAVNQVELHPFLQQRALVEFCREQGIVVEAWAPLTKGQRLTHPVLKQVAGETQRTTAQVMLRWALQKGFVVIPKSSKRDRIRENAGVFDFVLSAEQANRINALEDGFRTAPGWDPTLVP